MSKSITTGMLSATINGIKVNTSKPCSTANYNNSASRSVAYVVMHYTGNPSDTAQANANYFQTGSREASAHLFVDDTSIYQSVELRDSAWHCGANTYYHNACRNTNSIGIEMCTSGNYLISDKTKENGAYICKMLGITASQVDTYVLRHYDVTQKPCPAQMVINPAEWTAFKAMVKNILNSGTATTTETANTASTATTATTVKSGQKLTLSKVPLYASSTSASVANTLTGTYYLWSAEKVNNRYRITNSTSNVGKTGQVTGWIDSKYVV